MEREENVRLAALALSVALAGCAASSGRYTSLSQRQISEPRVIALDAPRADWTVRIEQHLRAQGFRVLRAPSQRRITRQLDDRTEESFRASATRYVLYLEADLDEFEPCWNGTPRFRRLFAELIDTRSNETVASFTGSGRSEDCPVAGTLYGDVTRMVTRTWVAP